MKYTNENRLTLPLQREELDLLKENDEFDFLGESRVFGHIYNRSTGKHVAGFWNEYGHDRTSRCKWHEYTLSPELADRIRPILVESNETLTSHGTVLEEIAARLVAVTLKVQVNHLESLLNSITDPDERKWFIFEEKELAELKPMLAHKEEIIRIYDLKKSMEVDDGDK